MNRPLNYSLHFGEAKMPTMRMRGYDPSLSFKGPITKTLLNPGTELYRLMGVVNGEYFDDVWWMRRTMFVNAEVEAFKHPGADGSIFREYLAQKLALPRGDFQLSVVKIELKKPVYGWCGKASGLYFRSGGADQVFLPNLADANDRRWSPYAAVSRTFWLYF